MEKVKGPNAVDGVAPVEILDSGPLRYPQLVIVVLNLRVLVCHPGIHPTPSSCPRSTMNGRGVIDLAISL